MSLRSVNLNLLPVLRALLRERNLSRTAIAVGLTQPAVSGALTRLRAIFGDPLLVRRGRGMELTLRAQELIEPVEQACDLLEGLMGSEPFEPARCDRRFVVVCADYVIMTIAPKLIRELERQAPNASVHFVDMPHPALEPHIREIDFFIVPEFLFREGNYLPLNWVSLIHDEFVTIVSEDHPLAKVDKPAAREMLAERYVLYYPALSILNSSLMGAVSGRTRGRKIVAQIQQFGLLPSLARDTGCAAIIPRRIADYMRQFVPIVVLEDGLPPIELDQCLAWNASHDTDPAHRWFRKLLIDHCSLLQLPEAEGEAAPACG